MTKKNVHVVPNKVGWSVKTEGSKKAYKNTETKREAEKIGKEVAKNNKVEYLGHNKNGQISERSSYGNDPCPPKDKNGK